MGLLIVALLLLPQAKLVAGRVARLRPPNVASLPMTLVGGVVLCAWRRPWRRQEGALMSEVLSVNALIEAFVTAATKLYPNAMIHWEDLGAGNARRGLRKPLCCV